VKKIFAVAAVALCAGFLCQSAMAYEKAITDTSGYVVQSAGDAYNESSIINGTHFPGGAPVAGKDYLVNSGRTTRTPGVSNADNTFKGDSFTLDEGANFLLKGPGSKITIADLRIYNAIINQGDGGSLKTLRGGIAVHGTPSAPSIIMGSGNSGWRRLSIESAISGASGTRIKVQHSGEADAAGNMFYTFLSGNNSGYAGSFEVAHGGNGIGLVGFNNNAFGTSPNITLTNGGKLFSGGSGTVSLSGAAITLDNGGVFGVYSYSGSNVGLEIAGGSTISGTGVLTINNSGVEGNHSRRVALGNVTITGIDEIQVGNGVLQLNNGYSNASIPVTVTQSKMFRTLPGVHVGPVTLQAGSYIDSANGDIELASLTFETTADGTPFLRKYLHAGLIAVDGNIVNNLGSGEKIRIDFSLSDVSQLAEQTNRVLSAANLGDAGVTAADFAASYDIGEQFRASITNGAFSIKTIGDVKYLVYALDRKVICSSGVDGYNDNSFTAGTHWNDGKKPHSDADYFIKDGDQIRSLRSASSTFDGNSLTVLSGGRVVVQGGANGIKTTIADLRLCGGGILKTTTDWGNNLDGSITIYGSSSDPTIYETAWASGSNEKSGRHLTVRSSISGSGSLLCRYEGSAATAIGAPVAGLNLRGDNTGFTGEWQIMHPAAQATFESAANFGSASALVLNSNGIFKAMGGSFTIAAPVVVKNVGSVSGNEELTNGGTIIVDTNLTLTVNGVVSGAGILRKTGVGSLRLNAENTISGNVVVKQGCIGGAGKVASVELQDGAGFDVSATQATPFEIGSLVIDGSVLLNIRDAANVDVSRVAVAKVGALTGALSTAKATVDGNRSGGYRLSVVNGILYATKLGMAILIQ
jgi:autotransporter-associated beta strand protein